MNKSYYAIIPANVRYDKDLTANAKLLYGEITALTNEKGFCWATNAYFAELYGTSNRTIQRWVKSLEDAGYIIINTSMSDHGSVRKITLNVGGDKNVIGGVTKMSRPHDKNVTHNNTVNNTSDVKSAAPIPKEKNDSSYPITEVLLNPIGENKLTIEKVDKILKEMDDRENAIHPAQYITNVLDLTPQTTLDRWGMNYRIDSLDIRDQMEAFANWYFMSLCEKLGEDEATERIMRMRLRALISAFETKFLRNYKETA